MLRAGPAWPEVNEHQGGFEKLTGVLCFFGFVEIFGLVFSDYFWLYLVLSPVVEAWFALCSLATVVFWGFFWLCCWFSQHVDEIPFPCSHRKCCFFFIFVTCRSHIDKNFCGMRKS